MLPSQIRMLKPPVFMLSPNPCMRNSAGPPLDGKDDPSFAYEDVLRSATSPAAANAIHNAFPASAPAAPKIENIPAPIIAPTPIDTAAHRLIECGGFFGVMEAAGCFCIKLFVPSSL